MKYYLETNALRAIGNKLQNNQKLLNSSYTSLFSIFEIMKGIGKKNDSLNRLSVLKN